MTEVTVAHTPRTGVHTLETGNQDYVFKGGVATLCNSAKLLDREDIPKMSYPVRKAGYPAYKSLTLGPLQDKAQRWVTGSTYRITFSSPMSPMQGKCIQVLSLVSAHQCDLR